MRAACHIPQNGGLQRIMHHGIELEDLALESPAEAVKNIDSYMAYFILINRLDNY